ncbi:MAG: HEAT repeat domain-containing protein, partial [Planctomycetia bacterium]|nr:HEAT repeat domain-containing protein [Planctomycetia bacterium]
RDYHKEAACFQILHNDSPEARTLAAQWLTGDDAVAFKATLRATRFVRSDAMTDILVQAYTKVRADRKPLVLIAIGDQRNPKGQATLVAALNSEEAPIKEAAVVALKAYADHDSFKGLIAAAISGTPDVRRNSIAVIQMFDGNINGEILALLKQDDTHKVLGVELVAARKIASGLADVFELAKSGSSAVRPAAIRALGDLAALEQFAWLIDQVVRSENTELGQAARDGLKTACGVVEDKAAAAEKLASAAEKLKGRQDDRLYLYRMLATVGGSTARKAVERVATAQDRESWDIATKVLGEWMDPDVGPILLNLANTPGYPYANRALRGYLRLAKQFPMPDWMRRAMVRDALASSVCKESEKATADLIVKQYKLDLSVPETADQKLIRSLEIQKAIYGLIDDPTKQKDVTAKVCEKFLTEGKATITFKGGYNKCFDGDPAPNVPKKMHVTVCDRITGKVKTITVGENAKLTLSR